MDQPSHLRDLPPPPRARVRRVTLTPRDDDGDGLALQLRWLDFVSITDRMREHGHRALEACVRDDADLDEAIELEEARAVLDGATCPMWLFDRLERRWLGDGVRNAAALGHVRGYQAYYQQACALVLNVIDLCADRAADAQVFRAATADPSVLEVATLRSALFTASLFDSPRAELEEAGRRATA